MHWVQFAYIDVHQVDSIHHDFGMPFPVVRESSALWELLPPPSLR
jgi:hypothetical protein